MKVLDNDLLDLENENFSCFSTESEKPLNELKIDEIEPHPFNLCNFPDNEHFPKRIRTSKAFFSNFSNKTGGQLKKEYLRVQLIRGHNRAIKQALQGRLPKKTLNKIRKNNTKQMKKWEIFKAYTKKRLDLDGCCILKYKSFNNSVCYYYFLDQETRKSFNLYCDVIFSDEDTKKLCKKFKIFCCAEEIRKNCNCKLKWEGIQKFIRYQMINELGINMDNE